MPGFAHRRPTAAVLLAAGAGTRLGRGPKALLPHRSTYLINHVVDELRAGGCSNITLVLGSDAQHIMDVADLSGCATVINANWQSGMGGSFRIGIEASPRGHDIMISLVDQPGINRWVIRRLLEHHESGRVTAAGYTDGHGKLQRGNPVLFSENAAREAAVLATGNNAGRVWLSRHADSVDLIDCSTLDDGGDVDTVDDLWRLG